MEKQRVGWVLRFGNGEGINGSGGLISAVIRMTLLFGIQIISEFLTVYIINNVYFAGLIPYCIFFPFIPYLKII